MYKKEEGNTQAREQGAAAKKKRAREEEASDDARKKYRLQLVPPSDPVVQLEQDFAGLFNFGDDQQ